VTDGPSFIALLLGSKLGGMPGDDELAEILPLTLPSGV
jgi:hypothetical protein